jgi:hypothetical protein
MAPYCSCLALAALLAAACAAPPAVPAPDADLAWDEQPGESLALRRAGEEIWRFHHGADRAKPCFHPLALPGGRVLTIDQPADHRWHHGLWFSWKLIDGVNYWENERATGRPAGRTAWTTAGIDTRADGSARLALDLTYGPADGAIALAEHRVLDVGAPGPDGAFAIDWDCAFTAQRDCVLDRTPLPGEPRGQVSGGYAGLSLRMVNLELRQAVTTAGAVEWNQDDRFRTRATAMEYDGVLADQEVGVAILDHPGNLNAPTPWYAIRSKAMTFFTPAVICHGPHRLAKGERFRLRYRVCVHPGRWDAARLAAAAADYNASAASRR